MDSYRTPLGRVRGLGAAKHGVSHFITQRVTGSALIVLLLWAACQSSTDLGMAGAAAAACGLLLGHHAYAGDCALLIPLSVMTLQRQSAPPWLKAWAVLLLSPAPTLLLVSQKPLLGQVLIAAFVITAVIAGRTEPASPIAPAA